MYIYLVKIIGSINEEYNLNIYCNSLFQDKDGYMLVNIVSFNLLVSLIFEDKFGIVFIVCVNDNILCDSENISDGLIKDYLIVVLS